jgi:asparaginyl-tRNA synthetase
MVSDWTRIEDAKRAKAKDEETELRGWIYRIRSSNRMLFLVLRDTTDIIQCVASRKDLGDDVFDKVSSLSVESSIIVRGIIHEDARAPGGYEMHLKSVEIVSPAERFPITKDQSEEFLRDNRHLWIRSRRMNAVMRIRSTVTGAIHSFFRERGYHEFTPPIFTPNQCEGGATLFEVKYYDRTIYLTQTWQLYAEAAIFSLEKIYDVSPTFRAERSKTSRHLSEFWMAEMEAAWMDYKDIIRIAIEEVKHIIGKVLENNRGDLEFLEARPDDLERIMKKDWPVITYTEALAILKEKEGMDIEWGKDLRTIEEERLMKHFDTPVTVIQYPKEAMAFYKPVEPEANAPGPVAKCFDMLAPCGYGEIIGGSERDTDIDSLVENLRKEGEDPENYDWYLDLRKYGSVPHSGYGLGIERFISWICRLDNIKDAIPFPRTMTRTYP